MRRLPIAFILAIFLPLICACGDEPRDYGDFLTDIVTYEGSSDDGTAMFSFQTRDDLPLQRLASSIKLPSDIVAGQRCLLRYTVVGNLADGTRQVRADGFAIIPTDGARKAPHSDMSTFPETEISVTSLWRSGTLINLNGWERKVIAEEEQHEDFVCWLRNPSRGSWALCIPYEIDGEKKPTYPDFLIIRRDGSDYVVDILEPHDPTRQDNLGKAKGFAEYARQNPGVGRIQLIRMQRDSVGRERAFRLDMSKSSIRDKVSRCVSNDELNHIFESDGFFQ